jgi:hypothetical protein
MTYIIIVLFPIVNVIDNNAIVEIKIAMAKNEYVVLVRLFLNLIISPVSKVILK